MIDNLLAVVSDNEHDTDVFEARLDDEDSEIGFIYFPKNEDVRVGVESIGGYDLEPLLERVTACLNACCGVPVGDLTDTSVSALVVDNTRLKNGITKLLALAVRSEFELATCADRGAGDVDHVLLPDLRLAIAEFTEQSNGKK